jgi:methionyl aminopeptidase
MIGVPGLRNRKVVAQRSVGELDAMAAAGSLVASALLAVRQAAAPGVSTLALDEIAESVIRGGGGIPSFLGYHGFPASICASVNDRVVHGIPSAAETLAPGDLVSIDCGAILDGWHGDSAVTFGIGTLIPVDEALAGHPRRNGSRDRRDAARQTRLTDVSHAIESRPTQPRRATTASSASLLVTAGTASAGKCTWIPSCPMRAPPAAVPTWRRGRCWPSNRC